MAKANDFTVDFGKIGRTIVYEDALGTVIFCFDIFPAGGNNEGRWNMELGSTGLDRNYKLFRREDHDIVFERVKAYAESLGYIVL